MKHDYFPTAGFARDYLSHEVAVTHITEFTVLVSLMGVGLALDRPLSVPGGSCGYTPGQPIFMLSLPATYSMESRIASPSARRERRGGRRARRGAPR